jgi:hypothetical protein
MFQLKFKPSTSKIKTNITFGHIKFFLPKNPDILGGFPSVVVSKVEWSEMECCWKAVRSIPLAKVTSFYFYKQTIFIWHILKTDRTCYWLTKAEQESTFNRGGTAGNDVYYGGPFSGFIRRTTARIQRWKGAAIHREHEQRSRGIAIAGTVTRQLPVKTLQAGKDLAWAPVNCKVWKLVMAL